MVESEDLSCHGNADEHCCVIAGKTCDYLEENTVPGRRWACGLLVKYGSWDRMNISDEYLPIGQHWQSINRPFNYCEAFDPRMCCREEEHGRPDGTDLLPYVTPIYIGAGDGNMG